MADNLRGHYAGFVTRLMAFLVDITIVSAIYSLIAVATQAIGGFFQRDVAVMISEESWLGLLTSAAAAIFPLIYNVFFWSLTGQTPGKAVMGIRVYTANGDPITPRRAILRYIAYWLSAALLFAGFLLALVDNRRRTLHDKLTGTVVVYDWEARVHKIVRRPP
jgi:uncharacterized RDD family membrane protein YckC